MTDYAVVMKWKQAEHAALGRLDARHRSHLLPIFELLNSRGAGQAQAVKSALGEISAVSTRWSIAGPTGFGIDGRYLTANGASAVLMLSISDQLRANGIPVIPCLDAHKVIVEYPNLTGLRHQGEVILRVSVSSMPLSDILAVVQMVKSVLPKESVLRLLLDMWDLSGADVDAVVNQVRPKVLAAIDLGMADRVYLVGGSFPFSLAGTAPGVADFPRHEWLVWQAVCRGRSPLDVRFGGYTVTNPQLMSVPSGAAIPVLAAIRYALQDHWKLSRGTAGQGKPFYAQYKNLCQLMLAAPYYRGPTFSYGDERIQFHADPTESTGSRQTWRRDSTSHHLVETLTQLGWP